MRWWHRALRLAVMVAASSLACSGPDSDSRAAQDGLDAQPADSQAAADGSDSVARIVPRADDETGSASNDPEADQAGNQPDWFTPYEERVYPLAVFIGELRADLFPESLEFDADPMGAVEKRTLDCMTAQGFRYEIVDWAVIDAEIDAAMPSLAEEDFMPTWGYGIAFSLGAPQVIEHSYVDPNEAIKDTLSADELEAWEHWYGECFSRASAVSDQSEAVLTWALWDDTKALEERVDSDSRVVEAGAEWSRCMAEQGHQYASHGEIFTYLDGIAEPLEERVRTQGGRDHIDAALQADLDALRTIEVEIATADLACSKRLDQVVYEVTVEHEQRFLDENQDRLALLLEELPTMTVPAEIWWR